MNNFEEARDEYQGYIPHVSHLVIHQVDKNTIAEYLYHVATVEMGLSGTRKHCEEIAQKILTTLHRKLRLEF